MTDSETFLSRCLRGDLSIEDIDDCIFQWHQSDANCEIFEFLGMTKEEYFSWVKNPEIIKDILRSRSV